MLDWGRGGGRGGGIRKVTLIISAGKGRNKAFKQMSITVTSGD